MNQFNNPRCRFRLLRIAPTPREMDFMALNSAVPFFRQFRVAQIAPNNFISTRFPTGAFQIAPCATESG